MRFLISAAALLSLVGSATAGFTVNMSKLRLADAAADACFANCAARNDSCRRSCPVTLNVPCLNACDSQGQTCRQGCQR